LRFKLRMFYKEIKGRLLYNKEMAFLQNRSYSTIFYS